MSAFSLRCPTALRLIGNALQGASRTRWPSRRTQLAFRGGACPPILFRIPVALPSTDARASIRDGLQRKTAR